MVGTSQAPGVETGEPTTRYVGGAGLVAFNDAVRGTLVSQRITASPSTFRARMVAADLGDVRLVHARVGSLSSQRERQHARASAGGVFVLLSTQADGVIRHADGVDRIVPSRLVIVPGSRSFEVEYRGSADLLFVVLREEHVARRFPWLDGPVRSHELDAVAAPISARLGEVVRAARAGGGAEDRADLAAIVDATLQLALRRFPGRRAVAPDLLLRTDALRLIDRHLDDPRLAPAWLATRLGASLRQLHRCFADAERSVATEIRERRLEACARLLADPATPATVSEVAARYGFSSAGHLARWFRRRYGTTPGAWRG